MNKNLDLRKLINIFNYLKPAFKDIPNMTDEHAICIFNYLINIMYIYKDTGIIDKSIFFSIILSCLTFKKDIAQENFEKIKKNNILDLLINDIKAEILMEKLQVKKILFFPLIIKK